MARIAIPISNRDHLALKLLSLQRNKRALATIQEGVRHYPPSESAYNLAFRSNPEAGE